MKNRKRIFALLLVLTLLCSLLVPAAAALDGPEPNTESAGLVEEKPEALIPEEESPAEDVTEEEPSAEEVTEEEPPAEEVTEEELKTEGDSEETKTAVLENTEELPSGSKVYTFTLGSTGSAPVDIVFVVDSTGSMTDEISNVRTNLNSFAESLASSSISYRISVIEYKDITEYGEEHSTKLLENDGAVWMTDPEDVADVLSSISATGGGDTPETVVDALGLMLSDALSFRDGSSKFAILLTDANYKTDNNYGYSTMDDLIADLVEKGINTSVISSTSYESTYRDLYTETDGIFCDIYGNFADQLSALADHVREIVNVVKITLTTEEYSRTDTDAYFRLDAKIESTDEENVAHNIHVDLVSPATASVSTAYSDPEQVIEELDPKASTVLSWLISVPIQEENANYQWGVEATSEDFAVGVVCSAVDSFSVAGSGEQDYRWHFGEDNYSFTNSPDYYGYSGWLIRTNDPIYIEKTDLDAFLSAVSDADMPLLASWYAVDGSIENLQNGNLVNWGGSCYGMSLTAALFKVGILDPADYGGSSTHDIPALVESENSALESMINIYHISQATTEAMESSKLHDYVYVDEMWTKANQIGKKDSGEQPFLVRLYHEDPDPKNSYGHAVVCYGAEEGSFSFGGKTYTRRLLIADPNKTKETYIYISEDSDFAVYSANTAYNKIGYRDASLSALNTYDYDDIKINHKMYLSVQSKTQLRLSDGHSSAIFNGSTLESSTGDFQIDRYVSEDALADEGGSGAANHTLFLIDSDSDSFAFEPEEGSNAAFNVRFEDFSVDVAAQTNRVQIGENGTVKLENAQGEVSISLAINDSPFDFVTIKGNADGEITFSVDGDHIDIHGNISNLEFVNTNRENKQTVFTADSAEDMRITLNEDGIQAAPIVSGPTVPQPSVPGYVAPLWKKGSSTPLKIRVFGTVTEVFVDGVKLTEGTDYTIEDSYVVLSVSFLENLSVGNHTLTIGNGVKYAFVVAQ